MVVRGGWCLAEKVGTRHLRDIQRAGSSPTPISDRNFQTLVKKRSKEKTHLYLLGSIQLYVFSGLA